MDPSAALSAVRKQGRRGGVCQRLRRQERQRIPLPSIILACVQSLRSKVDELQANVKYLEEYNNTSILVFIES